MSPVLAGLAAALATAVGTLLGLVFLTAAFAKVRDIARFRETVAQYRLMPEGLVGAGSVALPVVEIAVGSGLLLGVRVALLPAAALLGLFAAAVAINLRRGRTHIDCGCGGADGRRPISRALVRHDLILAALALAALAAPGPAEGLLRLGGLAAGGLFFLINMTFDRIVAVGALYPGGRRAPVAWTQI